MDKNLSGTQQARLDEAAFESWVSAFEKDIKENPVKAQKRVKDLWNKRYHCIQRKKMAAEIGLKDTQPFTKNKNIPERLETFENNLRLKFFPKVKEDSSDESVDNQNPQSDVEQGGGTTSHKEAAELRQKILELEAQISAMSDERGRYRELTEVFQRMARM